MIFAPDLAAKITQGKKTVTRRPVKRHHSGTLLACTYQPGKTYGVQLHRGGFAVDRILVKDVRRETLDLPLTWTEAAAEGFDSPRGFAEKWEALYGVDPPLDVWRIEFALVDAFPTERALKRANQAPDSPAAQVREQPQEEGT